MSMTSMLFNSSPNPYQEIVDKATSEYLVAPDWNINMTICDSVNADSNSNSQVVDALVNKFQSKDGRIIVLTITLAETLVMNCGGSLHKAIATKTFMDCMTMSAQGRRGAEAQTKALEVIQSWGLSFENKRSSLPLFHETYVSLKLKGSNFPTSGAAAPIFTPARSVEVEEDRSEYTGGGGGRDPFEKLRGNVEEVKRKIALLESQLAARARGDIRNDDESMLESTDFLEQCKIRILSLIEAGVTGALPEDLLAVFFQLNDEIEQILKKFNKADTSNLLGDYSAPTTSSEDEFSKLARRNSGSAPFDPFASTTQTNKSTDFFAAMGVSNSSAPPIKSTSNPFDNAFALPTPSTTTTSKPAKKSTYDDEFDEFLN